MPLRALLYCLSLHALKWTHLLAAEQRLEGPAQLDRLALENKLRLIIHILHWKNDQKDHRKQGLENRLFIDLESLYESRVHLARSLSLKLLLLLHQLFVYVCIQNLRKRE